MKQKTKQQLTNHLLNYYQNGYMDQNELNNFMHAFLDFVFSDNDLRVEDYNINIRFSNDVYDDALAFAYPCKENGEEAYSVIFRKTPNFIKRLYYRKSAKDKEFSKHRKESPKYNLANIDDIRFDAMLRAMFTAGHEFQHLVQFIKRPEELNADSEYMYSLYGMAEDDFTPAISNRQTKTFKKSIVSYLDCYNALSDIEMDADKNTVYYCTKMIETVADSVNDEDFLKFLMQIQAYILELRKERSKSLMPTTKNMAENQRLITRYVNQIKKQNSMAVLKAHSLGQRETAQEVDSNCNNTENTAN